MISAVVFLPLLGFLIAGMFGPSLGARQSEIVTTSLLFVSCLLSWVIFCMVGLGGAPFTTPVLGDWMNSGALHVNWALRVDTLTAVMLVVAVSYTHLTLPTILRV